MSDEAAALRALVAEAVADAELLAHLSLLADAGLPILISGPSRALTSRVAEAIADEDERAARIAARYDTTLVEPGHVAPVIGGL